MNLKTYFDQAKAASDAAVVLKNQMDDLFNNGTDEGIQAAIDLQPQMEAANKKADELNRLYLSMRDADQVASNAAGLFVADAETEQAEQADEKKMTYAAFQALDPAERMKFIRAGGEIE